jgi:hypothetical protein
VYLEYPLKVLYGISGIVNPGGVLVTQDELEALVDELGLVAVVSLLATICHNKAKQTLYLKGQGANPYTAWNSNGFLLKQLMTRLRPIGSFDRNVNLNGN